VSGAVMYAASSSLAAEERADMRARINDARAWCRAPRSCLRRSSPAPARP
jgi:hypothetical protein